MSIYCKCLNRQQCNEWKFNMQSLRDLQMIIYYKNVNSTSNGYFKTFCSKYAVLLSVKFHVINDGSHNINKVYTSGSKLVYLQVA